MRMGESGNQGSFWRSRERVGMGGIRMSISICLPFQDKSAESLYIPVFLVHIVTAYVKTLWVMTDL